MKELNNSINLQPLSISNLLDKSFFIPHYQRGYRWTSYQVEQLLEDIDSFNPRELPHNPDEKTFYCLQPIVVQELNDQRKGDIVENSGIELDGTWYEVIDGQQRLTTIYLILQYINDLWLGRQKKAQFKIQYETREECVDFLNSLRVNDDQKTVDIDKRNIDFYHISNAYQAIRDWELGYQEKNQKPLDDSAFQSNLLSHSKVIWYKVESHNNDGRPLFERLNLGKIPLTNAELTKALFLSSESFDDLPHEEKKIKQFEIATLWDEIEHRLNEPDKNFWSFITNKERKQYETKIDLILDLISDKSEDEKDPLYTFLEFSEKQKSESLYEIWQEIEHFYQTLNQWYLERDYYHKIGYLVAAKNFRGFNGIDLGELVKLSRKLTKPAFLNRIDDLIKGSVKAELSELRYDTDYDQLFNTLLLFNVESNRRSEAIAEFYPFKQHKANNWSLEHIHARNTDSFDKTKREPWRIWLNIHQKLLEEFSSDEDNEKSRRSKALIKEIANYNNDQLTWQRFNSIFEEVNDFLTLEPELLDRESEGIGNLALLSQPDNSALNHSVFEVKRRAIIELDKQGRFIPICTKRVFMKYYHQGDLSNQIIFWSKDDRHSYANEIEEMLRPYLPTHYIESDTENGE